MKALIIRSIFTLLLLWGVYTETGPWTTLSLFLVFVVTEVNTWLEGQRTEDWRAQQIRYSRGSTGSPSLDALFERLDERFRRGGG